MANTEGATLDSKNFSFEPDDAVKEENLFNAVESNNVSFVESFTKNDLQRLCQIRRLFPSQWSSPDEEKQTAYQRACLLGHTNIVQCMLNADVEVDQSFLDGDSNATLRGAFIFACQSRSMSTIKALIKAGAPIDRFGTCSALYADSCAPGIRVLSSARESVSRENFYPIHFAIIDDNLELFKELLTPTSNKLVTIQCFTPLHLVCLLNRSLTMIDLLLSYEDANAVIIAKTSNDKFPDELTIDQAIIDYLRPRRLVAYAEIEKKHQRRQEHDSESLQDDTPFHIFTKTMTGKTIKILVTRTSTVTDVKERIEEIEGYPPPSYPLIYAGKRLEDDRLLTDYNITKGSILYLVLALR